MKITRYFSILLFAVSLTSASAQSLSIGGVINHYTEVISFDSCKNAMQVRNADTFNPGDTIVIMQMKGAAIDSSNSANFGELLDYRSAGNYEFNYIAKKSGNQIFFKNKIFATYNIPDGIVQLIRVPYYKADVNVTSILTAANWDGSQGGVLVLNVAGSISLNANIDVSAKGFRGGMAINRKTTVLTCGVTIYTGPSSARAAQKGESIVSLSENINYGRGAPASGGGGGLDHNSGGGGGGNGGVGGSGGYQYYYCTSGIFDNRGLGGRPMPYANIQKVFMGGGGGAGDCNNDPGMLSHGGNGGGIAIIIGNNLITNTNEIIATGGNAPECVLNAQQNNCHDGMGGGGAGGAILISVTNYTDQATFNITGGKGADMRGVEAGQLGPGGGGGGGVVWFTEPFQPFNAVVTQSGGAAGINVYHNNDAWGATDGDPGRNFYSLELPLSSTPYTPNIESIGINQTTQSCTEFVFNGFAQTNLTGITRWSWNFGDGTQQAGQRVTHNYAAAGDYVVSLVAEDASGCKDTTSAIVKPGSIEAKAGTDFTVCANTPFTLEGSGGTSYSWTPGTLLNDSTHSSPTGSIQSTTTFQLIARDGLCQDTALVVVTLRDPQQLVAPADVTGCEGSIVSLKGNNGTNVLYEWTPAAMVSDPTVAEPTVTVLTNTAFMVKITENVCNTSQLFPVLLTVSPKPDLQVQKSNDIDCNHTTARLLATGADTYTWTPAGSVDNSSISNPLAVINATTQFTVTGTTSAGCSATDTITVIKSAGGSARFTMPNAFTPNNDGKNDCFGIQRFGDVTLDEFSVYNRWGQKVFTTKNPSECWNGHSQGRPLETGGYGYVVKGKSACGAFDFKGVVMLVR